MAGVNEMRRQSCHHMHGHQAQFVPLAPTLASRCENDKRVSRAAQAKSVQKKDKLKKYLTNAEEPQTSLNAAP